LTLIKLIGIIIESESAYLA